MFNFFKKTSENINTETDNEQISKDNILCSVNIDLTYDGTISIRYFWPLFNQKNEKHIVDIAHDFGILLYMINNGNLEKDMIETLAHIKEKNNKLDQRFTTYVLQEWLKTVDNSSNNSPIISPSNVFGQYRQ